MKRSVLMVLFFLVASPSLRGETIEEVEKQLLEAHGKLQSYFARLKHVEHVPLTGEDFMASDVNGTVEWLRRGDAILYRLEIAGTSTQRLGGPEQKSEQTSLLVCDGKYFFTYAEQMGQKRFIKQKADTSINGDIRTVLNTVRADNDFRLVEDDKVDGEECRVIEVTPKVRPSDDNPIHKTLIYFRKDNGLNVRVLSRNKDGKDIYDHKILDLKTNIPIDGARFILKQPPDVPLTDLTEIQDSPTKPDPEPVAPQKP